MKLADYLCRIDYQGPVEPSLGCLTAIHRQHLMQVSYENLDVQLDRPVDLDIERIFEKIVHRRRGGWCYEMNGLFGWALAEIGFDVMRMSGGVMRSLAGDQVLGNHLVLAVQLDVTYLADVGLGNGLFAPTPLVEGRFSQESTNFGLERLEDDFWRFNNHPGAMASDFDFRLARADEAELARMCENLQSDPDSLFRQNLLCFRYHEDGLWVLLGKTLLSYSGSDPKSTKRVLESADEFEQTLADRFDLREPDIAKLWARVSARHDELFATPSQ